ncbi:hypothetical protein PIB30_093308 [Stylosanthes scabra]|uniref:Uncharacterized protein n=1 Tax=Stylosanthes scabra TaxID=79078 RepID=A0ABU6RVT8_9FABA|nr:hypothetical protein [Stylosanthes scabra]
MTRFHNERCSLDGPHQRSYCGGERGRICHGRRKRRTFLDTESRRADGYDGYTGAPPKRTVRLPMPDFLMQNEEQTTRGRVHRFLVALPPGPAANVLSVAGRYSPNMHVAREDAAAEMIRVIIREKGFIIDDVNHEKAEKLATSEESLVKELQ